jgi:hypothetical protein
MNRDIITPGMIAEGMKRIRSSGHPDDARLVVKILEVVQGQRNPRNVSDLVSEALAVFSGQVAA